MVGESCWLILMKRKNSKDDESSLSPGHPNSRANDSEYNFRLVCSPTPTVASKAYMQDNEQFASKAVGERVEISPDSWTVAGQLAEIVDTHGGSGLIIDYGQDYAQGDTLRVSSEHISRNIMLTGLIDLLLGYP